MPTEINIINCTSEFRPGSNLQASDSDCLSGVSLSIGITDHSCTLLREQYSTVAVSFEVDANIKSEHVRYSADKNYNEMY